jgi:hypothetical protein
MSENALILRALRQPQALPGWSLPDWDLLLRQLRQSGLMSTLALRLRRAGLLEQVPTQPRRHLEWAIQFARNHAQAMRWELAQVSKALRGSGAQLLLLKGGAYMEAGLPCAEGRIFSDIDILVPLASLNQVEAELMLHGWGSTHHDAYDQRYYREWMHELPPMQHLKRGTVIDVHHAILPRTAPLHPDSAKLMAAAVPAGPDSDALVFAPADMVLHSAVHLFHDGEFDHGLRDLVDLHTLLQHFSAQPGFWEGLCPRANELELGRPLFYALRYTAKLLHLEVPSAVQQAAQAHAPSASLLALMDAMLLRALLPRHPSCSDAWTGSARFALYLRANWLRMPPLLLARHLFHKAFLSPKEEDAV